MKIGYKITDPDLRSAIVTSRAQVQYEVGKFVSRKFGYGPLLLLKDFKSLLNYVGSELRAGAKQGYLKVFVCKYAPSKGDMVWDKKHLKKRGKPLELMNEMYPGTVLAKKIMLMDEIPISIVSALVSGQKRKHVNQG